MDLVLYNIQGFRGEYKYSIDDSLTIINSKFNGVGKTTLYDCLKFVVDSSFLDRSEHKFFLNLREERGLFTVRKNDVSYGFILKRDRPVVFFRQVNGEELERSPENFPTAGEDLGLLVVNGTILNLFSKEVNLFSTSSGTADYRLVKLLTTDQDTEDMLENITNSLSFAEYDKNSMEDEKSNIIYKLENTPYYPKLDRFEEMLSNNFYVEADDLLDLIESNLKEMKPVTPLDFSSDVIELYSRISESIDELKPSMFEKVSSDIIFSISDITDNLGMMSEISEVDVSTEILELMIDTMGNVNNLQPYHGQLELNTDILREIENISNSVNTLQPVEDLKLNSELLSLMTYTTIIVAGMSTNALKKEQLTRALDRERSKINECRVSCPIREEVYLINGKCVY